ncbi:hypothetical protein [Candidatus Vondammii sp. HM_W22]|uniref:hypothetical protein n=1 Tax=Candidatus Vondammii sp. HM_W22 TaxID=2687299 RepID=UPI001F144919|nr:hypothetical protein [Candidatus Vondammii sp. HM_W22]
METQSELGLRVPERTAAPVAYFLENPKEIEAWFRQADNSPGVNAVLYTSQTRVLSLSFPEQTFGEESCLTDIEYDSIFAPGDTPNWVIDNSGKSCETLKFSLPPRTASLV